MFGASLVYGVLESESWGPSTTVTATIPRKPSAVFETVIPVDLSRIFSRWGPIPGVERTEILQGSESWDQVGMRRRVVLTDGSTIEEEIISVEKPHYFAYELSQFDFALEYLVTAARGEWAFVPVGDQTLVKWTYSFKPRSTVLKPVVSLFTNYLYRNYMRSAMASVDSLLS